MANQLKKFFADKKDMLEDVMEVFEQFQKVQKRLEDVSEEIVRIKEELKKHGVDATFFQEEENINNQFRKYMEILEANPKYREVKKNEFLKHFARTGGAKNLHILYNALTGNNFSGKSLLDIILKYEDNSRRPVEEYCARLKTLFCIGLIALLGHEALVSCDEEDTLLNHWADKMQTIQSKINDVIEHCKVNFLRHAEQDCCSIVRKQSESTSQQLAESLIEKLKKKYDWVFWSVRVFRSPSGWFARGGDFHCPTGRSRFKVPASDKNLIVWVSYSSSPEPVDKSSIQDVIQSQTNTTVVRLAEILFGKMQGGYVVHTVKSSRCAVCVWSFSDEHHYWEEHDGVFVCIHSV